MLSTTTGLNKKITFSQIGKRWPVSSETIKKIEYFHYAQTYWADFFIGDRGEFSFFHKKLRNTTSNHHFWLEYTILAFFRE